MSNDKSLKIFVLLFKKVFFMFMLFVYECLPTYNLSVCMSCVHIIQKVLDPLGLETHMVVSQHVGIKP